MNVFLQSVRTLKTDAVPQTIMFFHVLITKMCNLHKLHIMKNNTCSCVTKNSTPNMSISKTDDL